MDENFETNSRVEGNRTSAHDDKTLGGAPLRHVSRANERGLARVPPRARAASWAQFELLLGHDADLSGLARLLSERDLAQIARYGPRQLAEDARLAPRAARTLVAAFALGRSVEVEVARARTRVDAPARVHALLAPRVRGRPQEHFFALLLDSRHALRAARLVSLGTLTASLVHPREVFGPAVRESAAAVIVAHNHPSGDPTPSVEDVEVTRRLLAAGGMLGVPVLDHVVVADATWTSMRERFPELGWVS